MAEYVPNLAGVMEIGRSIQMMEAMVGIAETVAENARSIGPVDDDPDAHYVDMIEVSGSIESGLAAAKVEATKFTSWWIEFGTGEPGPTPAYAPLRRGAEMAGLVLKGTP